MMENLRTKANSPLLKTGADYPFIRVGWRYDGGLGQQCK